jgi:hypothetical protein
MQLRKRLVQNSTLQLSNLNSQSRCNPMVSLSMLLTPDQPKYPAKYLQSNTSKNLCHQHDSRPLV